MIRFAPRNTFYMISWIAWSIGMAWLSYFKWHADRQVGWEICFFKGLTHIPCPSCGATHAALALLDGNWYAAWMYNPLGMLILAGILVFPVWALMDAFLHKQTLFISYRFAVLKIRQPQWALPLGLIILLNWIWNISKEL